MTNGVVTNTAQANNVPGIDHLTAMGPISPQTNFPLYFQDHTGLTLELCTANNDPSYDPINDPQGLNGLCIYDVPDTTDPYQAQTGFGGEGFWWAADGLMDIAPSPECGTCGSAILVLGLEAAYGLDVPMDGDQFTFGRVRIRIDAPYAGTYQVTTPMGTHIYEDVEPGGRAINESIDIGSFYPVFDGPLRSQIYNFLVWDETQGADDGTGGVVFLPPAGFVGDPGVDHAVTGSPFGTNFFRVEYIAGPEMVTDPITGALVGPDLDGLGNSFVETKLFALMGLIFDGVVPVPMTLDRASSESGNTELVVHSLSSSSVHAVLYEGDLPVPLAGDGSGRFYLDIPTDPLPTNITITSRDVDFSDSLINASLVDTVDVSRAEYDSSTQVLTIEASSSSPASGPVLTALGYGDLAAGVLNVFGVTVPPAKVTVISSLGGSERRTVKFLGSSSGSGGGTGGGNISPVANPDSFFGDEDTDITGSVVANDTDADGTIDPTSVVISSTASNGTAVPNIDGTVTYTPDANFNGSDVFTYRVRDDFGAWSDPVAVSVAVASINDAPVANNDTDGTQKNTVVNIDVAGNDTDVDSGVDPATVVITLQPTNGLVAANLDGTVTYAPLTDFVGIDTFRYTIADAEGLVSNVALVTVTVEDAISEILTVDRVRYRTRRAEWRIDGTSTITVNNRVIVHLGPDLSGPIIGTGLVDAAGSWTVLDRGSPIVATTGDVISVETEFGASILAVPVTVR